MVDAMVTDHGLSVRQACRAARLARSAYYAPTVPKNDTAAIAAIEPYFGENKQHGFDKLYPVVPGAASAGRPGRLPIRSGQHSARTPPKTRRLVDCNSHL
jgi:hypothetical protein